MKSWASIVIWMTAFPLPVAAADQPRYSDFTDRSHVDEKGRIVAAPVEVAPRFRNAEWPQAWREQFKDRADSIIRTAIAGGRNRGNTYFENEKRTYGHLMLQILGGDAQWALEALQQPDHQARSWHRETKGIDYFACFTIKHQMRKYFYFGDLLRPDYRRQMFEGARLWTEKDPLRRPHYAYTGKGVWGPDGKNSWVDVRSTDNLYLMRTTSVYLMAEETGNEQTRQLYKDRFATFVKSLYRVGMGEWDSENYHGHSIAPVHTLYDFAKDPEVKLLAKACLDWFYTAGAVKYWRGSFNGPSKRDYNHAGPFQGSAAAMLWVMFGDAPRHNTHLESDEIHVVTSAYRAPKAVVHLARKNFDKPVEIFAGKPGYSDTQNAEYKSMPDYLETHYFGDTFQFGTLARGTQERDVSGFKILAYNSQTGADMIHCVPGPDPLYVGSPRYQSGKLSAPNRVAQYRNIALWLVEKGNSPWMWVLPRSIAVERQGGFTFLRGEKTWIALMPVNLDIRGVDSELTEQVNYCEKDGKREPLWPDSQVVSATGKGGPYCGFAVEIGEPATHGDYAAFKKAVQEKARVDASSLSEGRVGFTASNGSSVRMQYADGLDDYKVWRNGRLHDWNDHRVVYTEVGAEDGLVEQDWLGGTLTVRAGGSVFTCTVPDSDEVTFENR